MPHLRIAHARRRDRAELLPHDPRRDKRNLASCAQRRRHSRRRHLRDAHAVHPLPQGAHQHGSPHRVLRAAVQAPHRWRSAEGRAHQARAGRGRGFASSMSSASAANPGCGICAMIDRIKAGSFRDFVAELESCYVILGDQQFYRGYCVLFAKLHATELYLMPADAARQLSDEMRLVAEAIAAVVKPWKMNYECLGNAEPHVHWHLLPRFENDEMRRGPIWLRAAAQREGKPGDKEPRPLPPAL